MNQSADPSAMVSIATEHLMASAIALACEEHGIDYRELLQRARLPIEAKEGLGTDGANVLSGAASIATDILWQAGYFAEMSAKRSPAQEFEHTEMMTQVALIALGELRRLVLESDYCRALSKAMGVGIGITNKPICNYVDTIVDVSGYAKRIIEINNQSGNEEQRQQRDNLIDLESYRNG